MRDDSQASTSLWMATANAPSQSRLKESIRTDVCIVGAGIAGLTTAYLLAREGRSVVVLDDGFSGGGMTGRTTAHLSNAYDDRYVEIEKLHGEDGSRLTAESHTAAIEKISEIVAAEKIDCDFEWVDGFLFCAPEQSVDLLDDELARNPLDDDNVYIATGDSGQGMTHGTIAGMLLSDLIQGRKNNWEDLYSPSRLKVKSLPEYAAENINVAGQYVDYMTAGDIKSESELRPGEGAIMREGVSKVAVRRDENGNVHKLSAICPHLECVVAWNSTEQTWDCPCHGSRFSAEGRVYQGPANSDLSSV